MAEFTGERVIPGEVDIDLWNEHFARYAFASRFCGQKKVLDIGCGTGYGSAELARSATSVDAIDVSSAAVAYASAHYPGVRFLQASCTALPFPSASFDVIVSFEVIEHLHNWNDLLTEARRLLAPGGHFIVSTPNKSYYAETRKQTGPNPFHEHEFEFEEFRDALSRHFPAIDILLQNHTAGISFTPVDGKNPISHVRMEGESSPSTSHFYLAVCAGEPLTPAPAFVYIPSAANVLHEREIHIHRLEEELSTKNAWLEEAQRKHTDLVELFRKQTAELEERNAWAQRLTDELRECGIVLERERAETLEERGRYQREIARSQQEIADADAKNRHLVAELERTCQELSHCVELLDKAEQTVIERTTWAQSLDAELMRIAQTRWFRLGKKLKVGPVLRES